MNNYKVSLIIPCFNAEKYIQNTLACIYEQYFKDIEVICVNNGSIDATGNILEIYSKGYNNIQVITFEENQGLFGARLAGAAVATGKYILFMDSDDEITPGWVGALVDRAENENADLVLGDVKKKGDLNKKDINPRISCYQNLDPLRLQDLKVDGKKMIELLMKMHGLCSHYHYIWNKLIRRDLWENCLDDFDVLQKEHSHLVMGEDLAFSITLYCHARYVCNIHNEYYIYCFHEGQNVKSLDIVKFEKDIEDLKCTFDYFEFLLKKYNFYNYYKNEFVEYKQRFGIVYQRIAKNLRLSSTILEELDTIFALKDICDERMVKSEFFFSLMTNTSPIYSEYQKLLKMIYDPQIKVISFDIFDTLIMRPFADPSDIFILLNEPYAKIFATHSFVDFSSQRRVAEDRCHKLQKLLRPGIEEPTLDEIYDQLADIYKYDKVKLNLLKEIEKENEIKFSSTRKFGIELYERAKETGKRIILVSDMYLPKDCVEKILDKCKVKGYQKIYLSSEIHLTKHSGNIYPVLIRDNRDIASPQSILHIGDNYRSDVENAKKYGINAMHMPKAIGLLQGKNPGIYTGLSFNKIFKTGDRYRDMSLSYAGFVGVRSLCSVVANNIFDFPYVSFNQKSDLNADPRFIGRFVVGMHIYAVARWLIEQTRGKGYRKIHFIARDGYLVKQAYDVLANGEDGLPKSNYLYLSRKALAILDIRSFEDMYSLVHKMNFVQQSPDSIFELFKPVMSSESCEKYDKDRKSDIALYTSKFIDRIQFDKFIVNFYKKYLNDASFENYSSIIGFGFQKIIAKDDVFFDIGYSGRIEFTLSKLLGFHIKSFYIHTNTDIIERRKEISNFENFTFYNYKPGITGVIREHLLSEMCPSTIGYKMVHGELEPIFEQYSIDYPTWFVTKLIQENAIQFVLDVKNQFGEYTLKLPCRHEDISRPFEYYLHFSRNFDRSIFADFVFEDDLGEGHMVKGLDFWNRALSRIGDQYGTAVKIVEPAMPSVVKRKNRLMRALFYFLFDRKKFWNKLKERYRK